jgi:hypothetical protein
MPSVYGWQWGRYRISAASVNVRVFIDQIPANNGHRYIKEAKYDANTTGTNMYVDLVACNEVPVAARIRISGKTLKHHRSRSVALENRQSISLKENSGGQKAQSTISCAH